MLPKPLHNTYNLGNLRSLKQVSEGLPLELLQSVTALQRTLSDDTTAAARHNRSQIELLRAIGQVPSAPMEDAAPMEDEAAVPDAPAESIDDVSAPLPPPVPPDVTDG